MSLPNAEGLVLLVGPPAAGKSTFAAGLVAAGSVEPQDVLSSDAYREALTGDASDTSADRRVWVLLRRDLEERMAAGRTTVVDATNVFPRRRGRHIRVAKAHGRPVTAVVFDVPLDELLRRNAARPSPVPAGGVVFVAQSMPMTADPDTLVGEGVDHVVAADDLGTDWQLQGSALT